LELPARKLRLILKVYTFVKSGDNFVPKSMPLVAIGGINNAEIAKLVREAGADCVAVIGAITQADSIEAAAADLCEAMS
jgi:thiamine monophosphate synthase